MKNSNIFLGVFLALSLNNITHASGDVKTESTSMDCPFQTVTSAYIRFNETINEGEDYGKVYEDHMDKVKALSKTGNFNNFKIISHDFLARPISSTSKSKDVSINVSIEFDLNYKAITELNTNIAATDVNVSTFDQKRCQ